MKKHYFYLDRNKVLFSKSLKIIEWFLTVSIFVGINTSIKAQSGIYESYAILNSNGGENVYYDLQANSGNPDFQGADLGTFNSGNSLILSGAQNKVFKCNTDDIVNGKFYYRIYKTTDLVPVFIESTIFWTSNDGLTGSSCGGSDQNQTWQSIGANINILSSLTPGNYYLEIYTTADYTYTAGVGGSGTHSANNGGNNYRAQFTLDNPPIALCKSYTAQLDASGNVTINASDIDGGSIDDISIASFSVSPTTFTCANLGANNVTLTVIDSNGQTANCIGIVTVEDNQAPAITCPANISVNNTLGTCGAAVTYTAPVGTDNCSGATTTQIAGLASGAIFPIGTTTNTFEVTDAAGNKTNCSFTVTVIDNQAPAISCPANISVNNTLGSCGAVVTYTTPVGTDNCSGATTTQIAGLVSGATFPVGTTTNTFEVTDTAGNKTTCGFTVTVIDTQAPAISCPANITTAKTSDDGLGNCTTTIALGSPTVSDNCTATGSLIVTNNAPTNFPIGTTTVTWTVKDAANNTNTCNQTVTVTDNENPTINCPANVQVAANTGCNATVVLVTPTTNDNCSVASVTNNAPVTFPLGSTTVTWTVTDTSGNTATCTQSVTVLDQTLPIAICKNISVNLNALGTASITAADINNNSTDNCGIASVSASKTTFSCTNLGANSVILTVTDTAGNTSTCTATVTVVDNIAPVAICKNFTLVLAANGTGSLLPSDINNGSTDNCGIATMTLSKTNFTCTDANGGPQTVTLTVTDAAGNSNSCTATVTVQTTLAITATSNSVVCAGTTLNLFGNVTLGAFGTPTYSWTGPLGFNSTLQNPSISNVSMGAAGTYTLTVTNGNGCTITKTTTVIVNPVPNVSINPSFTSGFVKKNTGSAILYTYTITNIGSVPDIFDLSAVWINDNAESVDMDIRFKVGGTFYSTPYATPSIAPGGTFTFQVELQVQGNAPRVLNHTQLTATSRLCSISFVSADMYTYEYNGNLPTASGAQLELSKTASTASAIVGVPFNYVITIVNNSSSTSATGVIISDQVPANLTITNNGGGLQSGQTITWSIGTLTKIGAGINAVQKTITVVPTCALVPTVTNTANVFSTPPDNGLGVKSSSITIPVIDNIAPTAICKPITVNLNAMGVATITESLINNGSYDNCSIQSITINKSSFNCTNLGDNDVTLTVTDVSGNIDTCTSIVTVVDNQAPVFTSCPTAPAAICADNATSYTKVGTSWNAIAKDNCSFSLTYTLSGSTTGTGTNLNGVAFNIGTTTVTWTATDTKGNTSNCIFTVTINGLPVITTQPVTQLDCEGSIVSFNIVASGSGLNYIWQRKLPTDASFITIPVEANVSYPVPERIRLVNVGSAKSPSGTQYQVIVSNSSGCSVTSAAATLLVNEITNISSPLLTPPQSVVDVTLCNGANYSYTVSTSTPPPGLIVSYQWKSSVLSGVWNDVVDDLVHFSGAKTPTLNIIKGTPAQSAEYKVQVIFTSSGANCNVTTTLNRKITFLPDLTPQVATITQPNCITPTGSVVFNGLPASGTWTLTRSGTSSATMTGSGTSTIITGLAPGTYTYTVTLGTCTSVPSASVVIQAATTAVWNGLAWTNGPPTINQPLEFTGSYNSSGDLTACSCTVTNGTVVFKPTHTLKITNWVRVNGGSLTFEDTSSLVQINNVSNTNSGNILYERETTRITKMDYTYWASPVSPFTLGAVSPNTSGDKMYSYDSNIDDWKQESPSTSMVPGAGYIIRGPQNYVSPMPPSTYKAPFVGVPNNGHYEITGVIADRSYLLGNPYPSALDADTFLDANQNVLDGTLYFWTHNTPIAIGTPDPGSGLYAYSGNDYAAYNRTGGVSTAAPAPSSVSPYTGLNSNIPLGKIASGQGFFGGSKVSLPSNSKIIFDNSMRVGVGGITGDNSQFFKTKNPKGKSTSIEKHRIWVDLTNTQGAFKETLVGYVTNATNDYEDSFDGKSFDGNDFLDFYSVLQDKNLVIQGRALPFDENDEVPLGFRIALGGTFTIKIGQTDGVLSNYPVFIEDKLTNTVTNLKSGNYTFNTAAGTFDDRFVLRYKDKTLSVDEMNTNDGIIVLYSNNHKTLIIRNNLNDTTVNSVTLFNMLSQKIAFWDVKEREQTSIQIPIKNVPSEIYIVKVITNQGESSKKILIK